MLGTFFLTLSLLCHDSFAKDEKEISVESRANGGLNLIFDKERSEPFARTRTGTKLFKLHYYVPPESYQTDSLYEVRTGEVLQKDDFDECTFTTCWREESMGRLIVSLCPDEVTVEQVTFNTAEDATLMILDYATHWHVDFVQEIKISKTENIKVMSFYKDSVFRFVNITQRDGISNVAVATAPMICSSE